MASAAIQLLASPQLHTVLKHYVVLVTTTWIGKKCMRTASNIKTPLQDDLLAPKMNKLSSNTGVIMGNHGASIIKLFRRNKMLLATTLWEKIPFCVPLHTWKTLEITWKNPYEPRMNVKPLSAFRTVMLTKQHGSLLIVGWHHQTGVCYVIVWSRSRLKKMSPRHHRNELNSTGKLAQEVAQN